MSSTFDYGTTRDGLMQLRRRWRPDGSATAAVLLLHGMAEHSECYESVGDRFADAGFEAIAIDHRGYGRSEGRRGHCDSWSQFSQDLQDQLLEVRKLDLPTVVLGHSLGGLIAARYVVDQRPQPDLLVLSGAVLGTNVPLHWRLVAPLVGHLLPIVEIKVAGNSSFLPSDSRFGERQPSEVDPLRAPNPTARLCYEMAGAISHTRSMISHVELPTLVLHGGKDRLVPVAATEIFGALPNAKRVVYPDLGHELFNEPNGAQIIDEVIAWINRFL